MSDLPPFYALVREDLEEVERNLLSLSRAEFASLSPLLSHILQTPGKRVRPTLTLLASRCYPGPRENPIRAATAVELLHMAALVHDDTVDQAPLRRGRPTLNEVWGPQMAILVGDYLFALSGVYICDTGDIRVVRRFARTIQDLSTGEMMERFSAFHLPQSRDHYWERIYHKTASLFATAAEIGALLSPAPEEAVEALRTYGLNLGMAFQVVDDILDFEGDPQEVGKPVGADLAQGTLTLPALLLLERFPNGNPILEAFRGREREKSVKKAVEMVRSLGVLAEAFRVAEEFCRKATEALSPLPPGEVKEALTALASYVVERRK